jgi:hypothetical protein
MSNGVEHDTAYMELVELDNGDVVLRRIEDKEILVKIDFGEVVDKYISGGKMEVARAMLYAGFKAFNHMSSNDSGDTSDIGHKKTRVSAKTVGTRAAGGLGKSGRKGAGKTITRASKRKSKANKDIFDGASGTVH